VPPVKYERGFYIPEDDILHSPRRENLKSYTGEKCLPVPEIQAESSCSTRSLVCLVSVIQVTAVAASSPTPARTVDNGARRRAAQRADTRCERLTHKPSALELVRNNYAKMAVGRMVNVS
jgi:hypothetical protein